MASYELLEVVAEAEFEELLEVEFLVFEDPPNLLRLLFLPILGDGPNARAQAIRESSSRVFEQHKQTPASHWVKAVDDSSGKLLGAALWLLFEEDPYTGQP